MTIMIIYTSQLYNFSMYFSMFFLFVSTRFCLTEKTVLFQLKINFKRVISQVYSMLIFIYFLNSFFPFFLSFVFLSNVCDDNKSTAYTCCIGFPISKYQKGIKPNDESCGRMKTAKVIKRVKEKIN